ncbi:MAG: RNA polymerase sigma factor [Nitriliruptoraceae bacterium]
MTFEDTYQRNYREVVASSWAICRDREVAEDLAQEAFARAYGRWRKLENGGYAVPWLHRVVMNLTISHLRRHGRGTQLEQQHAATPAHTTDVYAQDEWLVSTLRHLPRRQREAVFLRYVAELDVEQVAAAMRCSTGTVKTHSKRGLDRLRDLMQVPTTQPLIAMTPRQDAPWTS